MPMIHIEYDPAKVTKEQAKQLAEDMVKFTQKATGLPDVYGWANASQIRTAVDPVEILVELSAHLVPEGPKALSQPLAANLKQWKVDHNFELPLNLTVVPMNWALEIGI